MTTPPSLPGAGGRTKVTDNAHRTAAQAIDEAVAACKNIHDNVWNARTTLSGGWTGDASNTYGGALDAWLTKLDELRASMEAMSNALMGTKKATTDAEQHAHAKAAAYAGRINR